MQPSQQATSRHNTNPMAMLSESEAAAIRTMLAEMGPDKCAKALGIHVWTVYKAGCRLALHAYTVLTIRQHLPAKEGT